MVKVVKVEFYITKKLPRRLNARLRVLQAKYQLRHRRRISEGRIVEMLVDYGMAHERELFGQNGGDVSKLFDVYASREKTSCVNDIDTVVYGV
ncbi:MAG: hypothetical protein NT157_00775 [Candidatus Micrarchaeota archaeon]|nr:hypothetical protein [Candidatus Micrarchaeota archaeon]